MHTGVTLVKKHAGRQKPFPTHEIILIIHLKILILGKKIQTHTSFDATLDLEPYMTPGPTQPHDMRLVGIISHHCTKNNGITRREDKWTLYNDAMTTQTTLQHIHQTQAYILMYRKTEHGVGTGEPVPTNAPKKYESQSRVKGNFNPTPGKQQNREIPGPQPDFLEQPPSGKNLPRQGSRVRGANPAPRVELLTENQGAPDTILNTHAATPLGPETKSDEDGGGEGGGSGENITSVRREDGKERPLQLEENSEQPPGEPTTLLQTRPSLSSFNSARAGSKNLPAF